MIDVGDRQSPLVDWIADRSTAKISDIVLTHNHADHIGAIGSLIDLCRDRIGRVWFLQDRPLVGAERKKVDALLRPVFEAEQRGWLQSAYLTKPNQIWSDQSGFPSLEVLFPTAAQNLLGSQDPNLSSAVLSLRVNTHQSIIWPGDNSLQNVEAHQPAGEICMLVGPHHGMPEEVKKKNRSTSNWRHLLKSINPTKSFISVGTDNSYNHPNPRYVGGMQKLGCEIVCSGLTRWCNRRLQESHFQGRHVLNGAALLGLRRKPVGLACRGAVRLTIENGILREDSYVSVHRERVAQLTHPFCLPRSAWKRRK